MTKKKSKKNQNMQRKNPQQGPKISEDVPSLGDMMASLASMFDGMDFEDEDDIDDFIDEGLALGALPPSGSDSFNPAAMEKMMMGLNRLLEEQDFETPEEMEAFLAKTLVLGQPFPDFDVQPETALEEAQEIIYEAMEAKSAGHKVRLARKALDISLDCADGYVILAEHSAKTVAEALAFYEAGVRAGERALADEFEEMKGDFWGIIETRPYMRARFGLAMTLWGVNRHQEASEHMAALLELNPYDNQGVRYSYLTLLLESRDMERIDKLIAQYPDEWTAAWKYNIALHSFMKNGSNDDSNALLKDAISFNPHVPPYLLGKKKPKKTIPDFYSPGDDSEALTYALEAIPLWMMAMGALAWLEKVVNESNVVD